MKSKKGYYAENKTIRQGGRLRTRLQNAIRKTRHTQVTDHKAARFKLAG